MEVDILIDKITDCLIDMRTGEKVETEYRMCETPIRSTDYKGWKFNWKATEKNGYHIYELFVKGENTVQGRISLRIDGGVADVDIVETAPHNYGHTGRYEGVGDNMLVMAEKRTDYAHDIAYYAEDSRLTENDMNGGK